MNSRQKTGEPVENQKFYWVSKNFFFLLCDSLFCCKSARFFEPNYINGSNRKPLPFSMITRALNYHSHENNLLNSDWGHFARHSIMYNILNCNGLLLQMYTSNDSLKDTYHSTIQVAASAKPLFIHSEIKILYYLRKFIHQLSKALSK